MTGAKRRRAYDDDDGRVVASMNVEGMPWYTEGQTVDESAEMLDRRQTRQAIKGALGAALLVAGVFIVAGLLFILFCTKVWFA